VGIGKRPMKSGEVEKALAERRARWSPPPFRHNRGILSLYSRVAAGSSEGALMTPRNGASPDAVPEAAKSANGNSKLSHVQLAEGKRTKVSGGKK
jgi:hypothetical protein